MDFIKVVETEKNKYRSMDLWSPLPNFPVYGGQIVAQALLSAYKTFNIPVHVHSLHAYFHIPGDPKGKIDYVVDDLREGRTIKSKRVVGLQNGKTIFSMNASFSLRENDSNRYQHPKLERYEDIFVDFRDYVKELFQKHSGDSSEFGKACYVMREHMKELEKCFIIKVGESRENKRQVWFKVRGDVKGNPDVSCIFSFLSDFFLIESALIPLGENIFSGNISLITSIDHTVYFHTSDEECSDEYFYLMECIRIFNSKALCIGHLMNSKNELIVTAVQEGIVRIRKQE
jgi:acyl-CoA thioesterase II